MNRFQKKMLLASAGLHGFLVLLLLFGSAFFVAKEKPVPQIQITKVPTRVIDEALAERGILRGSGVGLIIGTAWQFVQIYFKRRKAAR